MAEKAACPHNNSRGKKKKREKDLAGYSIENKKFTLSINSIIELYYFLLRYYLLSVVVCCHTFKCLLHLVSVQYNKKEGEVHNISGGPKLHSYQTCAS